MLEKLLSSSKLPTNNKHCPLSYLFSDVALTGLTALAEENRYQIGHRWTWTLSANGLYSVVPCGHSNFGTDAEKVETVSAPSKKMQIAG